MKKLLNNVSSIILAIAIVFLGTAILLSNENPINLSSIATGQSYVATSSVTGSGVAVDKPIKTGWGELGSVIITDDGDLEFLLLDATTSLEASDFATATALITSFPANAPAGTYQFDVTFNTGLYLDIMAGADASTTITYR